MRDERLLNVECFDEHFPGRVINTKDGLVLLDVVLSLFCDFMGLCGHCSLLADVSKRRVDIRTQ
jgi:hypothetical protein